MGQVNLYKIDEKKTDDFLNKLDEKFQFLGEQDYPFGNDEKNQCTVMTYANKVENRKLPEWKWILDEYEFEIPESSVAVKAILVIKSKNSMYAVTYGTAFFAVDKYCNTKFAFDFARRIEFKQIKTTTLTTPNSKRNKTVNVYLNYNDIFYDSGEAYAKIKAKMDIEENGSICEEMIEIGHSIKTRIQENNMDGILRFIVYVEKVMKQKEIQKIPVFYKVKDEAEIKELDKRLSKKIEENIECINISELDIIGVTEIFNNNDTSFTIKYRRKNKDIQQLTKDNILQFIEENHLNLKTDFLNIKVISNKDGDPVRTDKMKNLIDYTDDEKKCLLLKGEWYYYNDDYIDYLRDSIEELDVIYDSQYDFGKKQLKEYQEEQYQKQKDLPEYANLSTEKIKEKIAKKYYAESAFNHYISEKYGFEIYDRELEQIGSEKIELMDLYKDKTMYAGKIGESSAKLSYVVEQSASSLKMYKHKQLKDMPEIKQIAVWIILKRKTHLENRNGKPDLSSLKMITLKNRLDEWKKEVRISGYSPVVYLNYWED